VVGGCHLPSQEMLTRRCPETAHPGTLFILTTWKRASSSGVSTWPHVRMLDESAPGRWFSGAGIARWSASLHRMARGKTAGPSERRDAASSLKPQLSTGSTTVSVPVKSDSWTPMVCNLHQGVTRGPGHRQGTRPRPCRSRSYGQPSGLPDHDFGKFKFDEAQRAKESRRKTVHVGIKEMKYRPKIGPGDFDTKTRQVGKFLDAGHKVKITIMFRGREVYHPSMESGFWIVLPSRWKAWPRLRPSQSSTTET